MTNSPPTKSPARNTPPHSQVCENNADDTDDSDLDVAQNKAAVQTQTPIVSTPRRLRDLPVSRRARAGAADASDLDVAYLCMLIQAILKRS